MIGFVCLSVCLTTSYPPATKRITHNKRPVSHALNHGGFSSCHYFYAQHFLLPVLTALLCWVAIGPMGKYTVGPNLV